MRENSSKDFSEIVLPVLLLRGLVLFPGMILSFDVGRVKSIAAIDEAMKKDQRIFVVAQKNVKENNPELKDLYEIGVVAKIKQVISQSDNLVKVLVEGEKRARILKGLKSDSAIVAKVSVCEEKHTATPEEIAAMRMVKSIFNQYVKMSSQISMDFVTSITLCEDPGEVGDSLAANIVADYTAKQNLLMQPSVLLRLEQLSEILVKELNILSIEEDLNAKLINRIELGNREHYLREQMQVISEELGEKDILCDAEELREKILSLKLPKDVSKILLKECDRLTKMPFGSQEANVCRNYIDLCVHLPWNKKDSKTIDLKKAEEILNREHYGLEKVKERILETLSVRELSSSTDGHVLCLVGPPGVGKTSIAKSIARAINRKYARISLGGIHDESDIRGHRRTYVGAMPGRIISAINKTKRKNPVLLLDEIDKVGKDVCGDPVSALLEVLDPEQNNTFYDHYVDMPFDLSDVFFITTANSCDDIPKTLLDRMDVINLTSYTSEEKFNIAKKHLVPKQLKKHGFENINVNITDRAIRDIIEHYTKEAGVRTLDRTIASLFRRLAKDIVLGEKDSINVTTMNLEKILGSKKFKGNETNKKDEIGVVNGLAWTPTGGELITIEVAIMQGVGKVELTGSLGDVMRESAYTAISFIRSNCKDLGVNPLFYTECDIHVHVPQAAISKDGPSAGVTLATAIISALTDVPVRHNIAMTGEITLRGKTLPVGGIKEKIIAAYRAGITTAIIPKENESDLEEIESTVKDKMNFIMATDMQTVLKHSLLKNISQTVETKRMPIGKITRSKLNVGQTLNIPQ